MTKQEQPEVFEKAYQLYLQGNFQEAYDLLTAAAPLHPGHVQRVYEWRFNIAARMGRLELSEQILADAVEAGCFYGVFALRKDSDMQVMQGRPEFERLVQRNFAILAEKQKTSHPRLEIINEGKVEKGSVPLLLALHGNSSNVARFKPNWSSLVGTEWMVALPQSSQLGGQDIFVWNDMAVVEKEIKEHFRQIVSAYPVDPRRVILAGFSKGGHAAINAVLQEWVLAAGFIAVAPYVGDVTAFLPYLENHYTKTPKGYFLLGEQDHECAPGALTFINELRSRDFNCQVRTFPGMAHEFPSGFDQVLKDAMELIIGK